MRGRPRRDQHGHGARQGGWYRGSGRSSGPISSLRPARPVGDPVGWSEKVKARSGRVQPRQPAGRPPRARARRARVVGGREDLPPVGGGRRGPPALDVLRGPPDRQRPTRHPPRRGARLQGRLPPLQDDAGLPRRPEGRVGLPRAARRARRREGARLLRQGRHRGVRRRGVQRQVPRVGAPARRRLRGDVGPDGLLGRHRRRLRDDDPVVRRVGLVGAEADPRGRPAGRGLPRGAVLPPLRDRALRPRARAGLRDGDRPVGLCPVPPDVGAARRCGAAGVDDDPLDAGVEHRGRRSPGRRLRRGDRRQREARRRGAALRGRARRGLDCRGDRPRRRHGAVGLPASVRARRVPGRLGRAHRRTRGVRHHRGRHRPRAPVPRLRRGRHEGVQGVRAAGREPGASRRPLRGRRTAGRGSVLQARRRRPGEGPRGARCAVPSRGVRALVPALLALPHRAALLRPAVLVRPHHRRQGRAAAREREDQLVPRHDQVGSVRRLAQQQHRLGTVAQPLLGHSPADLALRRGTPDLCRVARRAVRADRHRPVGARPAPPVRRRRRLRLPGRG